MFGMPFSSVTGGVAVLPWPAEWSTPRETTTKVLAAELLGFILLVVGWFGTLTLGPEERGGPAVVVGLGACCVGMLTALDLRMLRLRRRGSSKAVSLHATGSPYDGVAISYSSRVYRLFRPFLLVTGVIVAGYAAGSALGFGLPPSGPPAGVAALTGGAAVCLLLAWVAWLLWVVVEIADGRVVRACLVLCPGGIYHRSYTFEHFVPWHAVVDVCARELRGPAIVVRALPADGTYVRRTNRLGRQQEFKLLPFLVVPGRSLVVDPAVAYHAVRYYEAHPEAREELLTSAGEQRVRSGQLPEL